MTTTGKSNWVAVAIACLSGAAGYVYFSGPDPVKGAAHAPTPPNNLHAPATLGAGLQQPEASAPVAAPPPVAPQPKTRLQKVNELFASASPEDRLKGYQEIQSCVGARAQVDENVRLLPAEAPQLHAATDKACEGLDATVLVKYRQVLQELAKSGTKGAALYLLDSMSRAEWNALATDPGRRAEVEEVIGHLVRDGKAGHARSLLRAGGLLLSVANRPYESCVNRVAWFATQPGPGLPPRPPEEVQRAVSVTLSEYRDSLSPADLERCRKDAEVLASTATN